MPGLALFGFQGEESELGEIELLTPEEGSDSDNEEDGPGPPYNVLFSFISFFCFILCFARGRRVEGGDTSL